MSITSALASSDDSIHIKSENMINSALFLLPHSSPNHLEKGADLTEIITYSLPIPLERW